MAPEFYHADRDLGDIEEDGVTFRFRSGGPKGIGYYRAGASAETNARRVVSTPSSSGQSTVVEPEKENSPGDAAPASAGKKPQSRRQQPQRAKKKESSPEPDAPPAGKKRQLSHAELRAEAAHAAALNGGYAPQCAQRKRKRWADEEVEKLKGAVEEYGAGNWATIAERADLPGRLPTDLKDKWRNLRE
jgi:hypothetical protein